jgi:enamine deaminase RidA (YjgF/YER057c/UK114 family)
MQFMEIITAPPAAGHYPRAVAANGLEFVSGVLPIVAGGALH